MASNLKGRSHQRLLLILQSTQSVPQSIALILQEISADNMEETYSAMIVLYKIIKNTQMSTQIFYRALQMTKSILETSKFYALLLVEVYLLPLLLTKINTYKESEIFKGEPSDCSQSSRKKQQKYTSHSEILVHSLLILAARVKPYRIAAYIQLNQPSDFQVALKQIKKCKFGESGIQKDQIQRYRDIFIDDIKNLPVIQQKCTKVLINRMLREVKNDDSDQLEIMQLLKSGDHYSIATFLKCFNTVRIERDQFNLKAKLQYYEIFDNLFRCGYIQTIVLLMSQEFSSFLFKEIVILQEQSGEDQEKLRQLYKKLQNYAQIILQTYEITYDTWQIQLQRLINLLNGLESEFTGKPAQFQQMLRSFQRNQLRNTKIYKYLQKNSFKVGQNKSQISSKMRSQMKENFDDNVIRIEDYEIEQLSEFDAIKNKYEKTKRHNKVLLNSKSSSILDSVRISLSSKFSNNSQLNQKSLGKASGIKLYSQLKKNQKQSSNLELKSKQVSQKCESNIRAKQKSIINIIDYVNSKKRDNSKIQSNLQKSSICVQQYQESDLIEPPDINPQRNSYFIQNQQTSIILDNQALSFKAALNDKFLGFDNSQKQLRIIQQNQVLKNVVKSPKVGSRFKKQSQYMQTGSSKISNFIGKDMIFSRKTQSITENLNRFDEKSQRSEIALLQQKIRRLQKEKLLMKTQLAIKSNELDYLKCSSVYGSQKNLMFYQTPTDSGFFPKQPRQKSVKSNKFSRRKEESEFQRQIEVNYKQYLQTYKGNTFCKNLLRTKCLVTNTPQIQVGLLSKLQKSQDSKSVELDLTFYFTFHRFQAKDFSLNFIQNSAFKFYIQKMKSSIIKLQKQQKVIAKISLLSIPYNLPQVQITYGNNDSDSDCKKMRLVLPLSFNKFVEIPKMNISIANEERQCLRTNVFQFNTKNINPEKILDYLPGWKVINEKRRSDYIIYVAVCFYKQTKFEVKLKLSQKGSLIEGYLEQGDNKIVEFYVSTLKSIFELKKK